MIQCIIAAKKRASLFFTICTRMYWKSNWKSRVGYTSHPRRAKAELKERKGTFLIMERQFSFTYRAQKTNRSFLVTECTRPVEKTKTKFDIIIVRLFEFQGRPKHYLLEGELFLLNSFASGSREVCTFTHIRSSLCIPLIYPDCKLKSMLQRYSNDMGSTNWVEKGLL